MQDDDIEFFEKRIMERRVKEITVTLNSLIIIRDSENMSKAMTELMPELLAGIEQATALKKTLQTIEEKLKD